MKTITTMVFVLLAFLLHSLLVSSTNGDTTNYIKTPRRLSVGDFEVLAPDFSETQNLEKYINEKIKIVETDLAKKVDNATVENSIMDVLSIKIADVNFTANITEMKSHIDFVKSNLLANLTWRIEFLESDTENITELQKLFSEIHKRQRGLNSTLDTKTDEIWKFLQQASPVLFVLIGVQLILIVILFHRTHKKTKKFDADLNIRFSQLHRRLENQIELAKEEGRTVLPAHFTPIPSPRHERRV